MLWGCARKEVERARSLLLCFVVTLRSAVQRSTSHLQSTFSPFLPSLSLPHSLLSLPSHTPTRQDKFYHLAKETGV